MKSADERLEELVSSFQTSSDTDGNWLYVEEIVIRLMKQYVEDMREECAEKLQFMYDATPDIAQTAKAQLKAGIDAIQAIKIPE